MTTTAPAKAADLAADILQLHPGLDQMQLHKLLYLVQAANLAWFHEPAFSDRIEAWQYGPMVMDTMRGRYNSYGKKSIPAPNGGDPDAVPSRTHWVVEQVVTKYAEFSGPALAKMVKDAGSPWRAVRGDLPDDAPSQDEISVEMIETWHSTHGVTLERPTMAEQKLAQKFFDGDDEALGELLEAVTGHKATVE
jgi:uncharacterized phage-associated protein